MDPAAATGLEYPPLIDLNCGTRVRSENGPNDSPAGQSYVLTLFGLCPDPNWTLRLCHCDAELYVLFAPLVLFVPVSESEPSRASHGHETGLD